MSRTKALALVGLLLLCTSAEAQNRRNFRDSFVLDYPLIRPFQLNPAMNNGFGGYGYGGGYYHLAPPSDVGRLERVNGLIDEYVAEQRLEREVNSLGIPQTPGSLRLENEQLQQRVANLERKLSQPPTPWGHPRPRGKSRAR